MNLEAACKFNLTVYTKLFKDLNVLFIKYVWKGVRCRLKVVKSALFCFLNPRIIITVSVENDSLVLFDCLKNKVVESSLKVRCFFKKVCKLAKLFCNNSVKEYVCTSD